MATFWLGVVAAPPVPWTEAMRLAFWAWQPVVVFFLNFFSLTIAVAAFVRAGQTDRKSQIRTRLFSKIAAIRDASEKAAVMVEHNLLGMSSESLTLAQGHQQISVALKQLEIKVDDLQRALPWEREAIFRAYHTWKQTLTGDGYPVLKKADMLKLGNPRIAAVQIAQTQFLSAFNAIEEKCILESVPFWKRLPRKALPPSASV